jgi:hypothetical protein
VGIKVQQLIKIIINEGFSKAKEVKSMKKFFLAISLVAVLGFIVAPANALVGVPDDVPGTDIMAPFIYVSMPGFGNENTLITITEVNGTTTQLAGWVNDIDSVQVFNFGGVLTPFDVFGIDGLTLINMMGIGSLAEIALRTDTDGDGVPDHWVGYVYFFNLNTFENLISNIYQVYLPAGMAAAINGVSFENKQANVTNLGYSDFLWQTNGPFAIPFSTWGWNNEAFSANALNAGNARLALGSPAPIVYFDQALGVWTQLANFFRLLPRYFVLDSNGLSLLIIWTDTFYTQILPPGTVHCNFWNEDEYGLSANIPIDHELNILRVNSLLPGGLFPVGVYPQAGWIDIATPDIFRTFIVDPQWNFDWNLDGMTDGAQRQWLVYSWQRAIGPAAEAWEVIHPAHRQAIPF